MFLHDSTIIVSSTGGINVIGSENVQSRFFASSLYLARSSGVISLGLQFDGETVVVSGVIGSASNILYLSFVSKTV